MGWRRIGQPDISADAVTDPLFRYGTPRHGPLLDVVAAIDPVERITSCPLGLSNHGGELCPLHKAVDCAAEKPISTFDGVTLQSLVNDPEANRPLCDEDLTSHFKLTVGETGSANGSNGTTNGNA